MSHALALEDKVIVERDEGECRLLTNTVFEFERDFDFGLVFALGLSQFEGLVFNGHPHEVIERLLGPINGIVYGVFETVGTPAD